MFISNAPLFSQTSQPVSVNMGDSILSKRMGNASYYSVKFQGRKTSNGERLDNNAYTCAHSRLPFGTYVRVTNKKNGKSVVVRVTDRFGPGSVHLVDLTLQAARDIDMIREGIAKVTVEVLNPFFARILMPKDTISRLLPIPDWFGIVLETNPPGSCVRVF